MILRANICPPICGPQTPACTSLITLSVEALSKHNSNIPSAECLYNVLPQITNQAANCLSALLSLVVVASRYTPSLRKWYMSWYQGRPSSISLFSIRQQYAGADLDSINNGRTVASTGMSIMEARVAKASANWFYALGRRVYLKSSNLSTSSSKYAW